MPEGAGFVDPEFPKPEEENTLRKEFISHQLVKLKEQGALDSAIQRQFPKLNVFIESAADSIGDYELRGELRELLSLMKDLGMVEDLSPRDIEDLIRIFNISVPSESSEDQMQALLHDLASHPGCTRACSMLRESMGQERSTERTLSPSSVRHLDPHETFTEKISRVVEDYFAPVFSAKGRSLSEEEKVALDFRKPLGRVLMEDTSLQAEGLEGHIDQVIDQYLEHVSRKSHIRFYFEEQRVNLRHLQPSDRSMYPFSPEGRGSPEHVHEHCESLVKPLYVQINKDLSGISGREISEAEVREKVFLTWNTLRQDFESAKTRKMTGDRSHEEGALLLSDHPSIVRNLVRFFPQNQGGLLPDDMYEINEHIGRSGKIEAFSLKIRSNPPTCIYLDASLDIKDIKRVVHKKSGDLGKVIVVRKSKSLGEILQKKYPYPTKAVYRANYMKRLREKYPEAYIEFSEEGGEFIQGPYRLYIPKRFGEEKIFCSFNILSPDLDWGLVCDTALEAADKAFSKKEGPPPQNQFYVFYRSDCSLKLTRKKVQ